MVVSLPAPRLRRSGPRNLLLARLTEINSFFQSTSSSPRLRFNSLPSPRYGTSTVIPSRVNLPSAQDRWLPSGRMPPLCSLLSLSVSASAIDLEAISSMSSSSISQGGGDPEILSMVS